MDIPATLVVEIQKSDLLSRLFNTALQYESFTQAIEGAQGAALQALLNANTALPVSSEFQKKERLLNQYFLEGGFATNTPRNVNWTAIKSIADLCPWEFGPVVHTARSMYLQFRPDYYWSDTNCPEPEPVALRNNSTNNKPVVSSNWIVYPNPAQDYIRFDSNNTQRGTTRVQIINSLGTVVTDKLMESGTEALQIQTAQWPAGVYYYRIHQGADMAQGQFVIIQKY